MRNIALIYVQGAEHNGVQSAACHCFAYRNMGGIRKDFSPHFAPERFAFKNHLSSTRLGAVRYAPTTASPFLQAVPRSLAMAEAYLGHQGACWPGDTLGLEKPVWGQPGNSDLHDRQWSSQLMSFLVVSEQGQVLWKKMDIWVLWPPVTSVPSLRLRKGMGHPCHDRC